MRSEYAKLYGQRTEERLNTGLMNVQLARAKHREWSSEIEARIANIRATATAARSLRRKLEHWLANGMSGLSRV